MTHRHQTVLVLLAIAAVRGYQALLAPFSGGACRFHPSCSAYAAEALGSHGLAKGLGLAVRRISRCRPWGPFGWDPVPPAPEPHSKAGGASPSLVTSRRGRGEGARPANA